MAANGLGRSGAARRMETNVRKARHTTGCSVVAAESSIFCPFSHNLDAATGLGPCDDDDPLYCDTFTFAANSNTKAHNASTTYRTGRTCGDPDGMWLTRSVLCHKWLPPPHGKPACPRNSPYYSNLLFILDRPFCPGPRGSGRRAAPTSRRATR